jgi:hypothetical protein
MLACPDMLALLLLALLIVPMIWLFLVLMRFKGK